MATLLFTGFPGFLGSELLPRVLARDPEAGALCVVQAKFAAAARRRADDLIARYPGLTGRIELVEGDITRPGLALASADALGDVTAVYHLAAVYDLAVERDLGLRVNVDGTRHVLDVAADCPRLERVHYVSTCYVSGRHPGEFREDDLEVGQRFNNHYEETKYLAEVDVRDRMRGGLPATVYRPAIVVGDAATGATQKYDGPYYVIRWILRQPGVAVLPVVGDADRVRPTIVPRNFLVDAVAHLSGSEASLGRTYQLADPDPASVDELIRLFGRATGRRVLRVRLPLGVAKGALDRVPGMERLTGIPAPALDYFAHSTRYDTTHARADLAGTDIRVPRLADYVDRLVAFVRAHPEIGSQPMV